MAVTTSLPGRSAKGLANPPATASLGRPVTDAADQPVEDSAGRGAMRPLRRALDDSFTEGGVFADLGNIGERQCVAEEVHVWTADARESRAPEQMVLFESWLSPEETKRYRRYHRRCDRKLFLLAHALLRRTLSRYADVGPAEWRFDIAEHGRPELSAPFSGLGLRFNISHTPGLAAVVISNEADAGIDV